jgi:hypothetical protein
MITEHKCEPIKETPWKDRIKECCNKEDPDHPKGCDCCYDNWSEELKEVTTRFWEADEEAKQIASELAFITDRQYKLKNWHDDLSKTDELSRNICDQLEVLIDQTEKIATNTLFAVKAIKVLYCMIRDFYMQVDLIKAKYDQIQICISCLHDPVLDPGQGIVKCLKDYGVKLDALIATRDELVKLVMEAIYTAYRINKNLDEEYGLHMVISEWKSTFNCEESCQENEEAQSGYAEQTGNDKKGRDTKKYNNGKNKNEEECVLAPVLQFPICNDPYYHLVKGKYDADKAKVSELAKKLVELNKKKESLLACKLSLQAAIKETDPKARFN